MFEVIYKFFCESHYGELDRDLLLYLVDSSCCFKLDLVWNF